MTLALRYQPQQELMQELQSYTLFPGTITGATVAA